MRRRAIGLSGLCFFMFTLVPADARDPADTCWSCHQKETPAIVNTWSQSAHASHGIGCGACHGDHYDSNHVRGKDRKVVEAHVCSRCHGDIAKEHFSGKHGIGFRASQACTRNKEKTPEILAGCSDCHEKGSALPRQEAECARFLAQSPEMQRQGCLACHKVANRCDSCHTPHATSLDIVRDPAVCATCHMGPDHPQYEMWTTSRHGIMYRQKGRDYSPGCNTCHMSKGNHNVSLGMTMGLAGQAYSDDVRQRQRAKMLEICAECHTSSFAVKNLEDADAIQRQSRALVEEAASIIRELEQENLLAPSPTQRPAHPLSGQQLEIGSQMLYENLSRIEAVFFRMKKFYYVITYKGVFHQNPDYAHWYGNAPLKLALSEIKSEAALLRALKRLRDRVDNLSALGHLRQEKDVATPGEALTTKMRLLRELHLRGDLSEEEYIRRKDALLEEHGL